MVKKVSPKVVVFFDESEEENMIDGILDKEMTTLEEYMRQIEDVYTAEEEVFSDEIEQGEIWFTVIPEKIPEEEVD